MFDQTNFMLLSCILMRMSGLIILNPILGRRNVPALIKSGFVIMLTLVVYTSLDVSLYHFDVVNMFDYAYILLREFFMGYVLGFVVTLFLYIIILGGEVMDMQMGLSMSKIYDAQSNASLSLSATYYNILFMLLFFTTDAHLNLLRIFITSGQIVPYGSVHIVPQLGPAITQIFCQCTVLAVKLSLPIVSFVFIAEIGVGILMKTIPQVNVFVVSIQAKVFLGFILMLVMFSPMANFLGNVITAMFDAIENMLFLMR